MSKEIIQALKTTLGEEKVAEEEPKGFPFMLASMMARLHEKTGQMLSEAELDAFTESLSNKLRDKCAEDEGLVDSLEQIGLVDALQYQGWSVAEKIADMIKD